MEPIKQSRINRLQAGLKKAKELDDLERIAYQILEMAEQYAAHPPLNIDSSRISGPAKCAHRIMELAHELLSITGSASIRDFQALVNQSHSKGLVKQCEAIPKTLPLNSLEKTFALNEKRKEGSSTIRRFKEEADSDWEKANSQLLLKILDKQKILLKDILNLHRTLVSSPDKRPGQLRVNGQEVSAGQAKFYPAGDDVQELMNDFMEWFDQEQTKPTLHPIIFAASVHQRLISIHPFNDGNGRTCRLLMDFILMKNGYPPPLLNDMKFAIFARIKTNPSLDEAILKVINGIISANKELNL